MKVKYNRIKSWINNKKRYFYLSNIILFIFKILLFFLTKSLSFIISSSYNLCIGIAKKNIYKSKNNNSLIGIYVILAGISFISYSIWTIYTHKTVNYSLYTGVVIATVTFFDIGYAIYNIVKNIKEKNKNNKYLSLINLATALISLELTQSALLSFTMSGVDNSLHNGLIGIVVGLSSILIGIIIKNNK